MFSIMLIIRDQTPVYQSTPEFTRILRNFQALTSLALWLRLFLLLRSFSWTAHLVQMILQTFHDVGAFILVLCIAMVAFADAFYAILANQDFDFYVFEEVDEFSFILALRYAFMLTAGMAEPSVREPNGMFWFIFIIGSAFNLIMMLNLLIAIIN